MSKEKLRGLHSDLIISDNSPTKWQKFIHKLNPFVSKEKKRVKEKRELKKRVYKLFKNKK